MQRGRRPVRWTAPSNPGNHVTIVKKGDPVGTYTQYFYTKDDNPGRLSLPDQPGECELRYSSEQASPNSTLYSLPLTVKRSLDVKRGAAPIWLAPFRVGS